MRPLWAGKTRVRIEAALRIENQLLAHKQLELAHKRQDAVVPPNVGLVYASKKKAEAVIGEDVTVELRRPALVRVVRDRLVVWVIFGQMYPHSNLLDLTVGHAQRQLAGDHVYPREVFEAQPRIMLGEQLSVM